MGGHSAHYYNIVRADNFVGGAPVTVQYETLCA